MRLVGNQKGMGKTEYISGATRQVSSVLTTRRCLKSTIIVAYFASLLSRSFMKNSFSIVALIGLKRRFNISQSLWPDLSAERFGCADWHQLLRQGINNQDRSSAMEYDERSTRFLYQAGTVTIGIAGNECYQQLCLEFNNAGQVVGFSEQPTERGFSLPERDDYQPRQFWCVGSYAFGLTGADKLLAYVARRTEPGRYCNNKGDIINWNFGGTNSSPMGQ